MTLKVAEGLSLDEAHERIKAQCRDREAVFNDERDAHDEEMTRCAQYAAGLAKEITALKIEVSRLESCLFWEQNRATRVGTHGPDCHLWGPAHYECLVRKFAAVVTAPPPQYQD